MEPITDWIKLWGQLVEGQEARHKRSAPVEKDSWRARACGFDKKVRERWARPDSSRDFILANLTAEDTVLDIGAGTGAWSVLMARKARSVTALDPSPAMLEVLEANLATEGIRNVQCVQGAWPQAEVAMHDVSLCSHAMYMTADLPTFVRRQMAVTRRRCYWLMRSPLPGGVMWQAAQRVWGQPHDSPNFVVGYNALLQMGLFPHVQFEDTGAWGAWTNPSLEEALDEVKRKLGLEGPSEHDAFLRDLLRDNLTEKDGQWAWPPSMRSALVYWEPVR